MTILQYKNFVAVAETHSITHAAEKLMIAQPALTAQIKHIEEELGVKLFHRHPRSVELTEAGKALYKAAKAILQIEENALIEMENLSRGQSGVLYLGITYFLPDDDIQAMIQRYYELYPNITVHLVEADRNQLIDQLRAGIVEVAIMTTPDVLPIGFRVLASRDNYMYACVPKESPYLEEYENGSQIPITALKNLPLSIPSGLSAEIEEQFQRNGMSPNIRAIGSTKNATRMLAEYGNMVALQASVCDPVIPDFRYYRLHDQFNLLQRCVVIAEGRELTIAATNFLKLST